MFSFFEPKVPEISVGELKRALDAGGDFVLLDVRTPEEYARGRISGSVNVPVDEVAGRIAGTIPDRSKTVYVYCLSGSRSAFAVNEMRRRGYAAAWNVTHGLLAWRAHYYPVITPKK